MQRLKVGDQVVHLYGSPTMTIISIVEREARCRDDANNEELISIDYLKLFKPPNVGNFFAL